MRNWIIAFFLFGITSIHAQDISLNGYLSWFSKVDSATIKSTFQNGDFRLVADKDSAGFKVLKYVLLKDVNEPSYTFLLGDSSLVSLTIENFIPNVHKTFISQLKANKFKNLGADVNGDFITTAYDNGTFIFNQDYEVVDNPTGKGQIPHYRYRIVKKNGVFDALNGTKKKVETIDGKSYTVIENYKNGVLEGERITYFPDDSIVKKKENYRGGRLNGTVSDYDEKGRLMHSSVHSYHWKYGMEKWYDGDGKLVRSLQWQRDIPVGSEKYTFNGKMFTGATYKNGKREGVATVPVGINWIEGFQRFAIPVDLHWGGDSWIVTKIKALETVNFVNDIKTGRAVGISPFSNDTLYVCYYKNGVIDSLFTGYELADYSRSGKNVPMTQTTFVNGLENGKRISWIRDGQYKDSISNEEYYVNGKLNGTATQFYSRTLDRTKDWFPYFGEVNYVNGVLSGSYRSYQDANNYQNGAYLNGKPNGKIESSERTEKFWLKTTEYYTEGIRTGEWISENLLDSIVITENYLNDKKHGISATKVKGKIVEQRSYISGYLYEITEFTEKGYDKFTLVTNEVPDLLGVKYEDKIGDQYSFYHFTAKTSDFPETDTTLLMFKNRIGDEDEAAPRLNGKFEVRTPNYVKTGTYSNSEPSGYVVIEHKNAGVYEQLTYEDGRVTAYGYTNVSTNEAFTGTFLSDVDGSSVSVKDGMRHGWHIEYDRNGNVIRKTKYVKGILKKTIENLSAAQADSKI
jgi:antitoxin component YwqK of YwqJK toxin-antitoxin module